MGPDVLIPVILITAANDPDSAIEAMKQGAFGYRLKPLDTQ
jgi:DNA-binding NtrC family response regulator